MENNKYIHQGKVRPVLFTHPDAKRPTLPQILLEILLEILLGNLPQILPGILLEILPQILLDILLKRDNMCHIVQICFTHMGEISQGVKNIKTMPYFLNF